jgi:hypothetical protein
LERRDMQGHRSCLSEGIHHEWRERTWWKGGGGEGRGISFYSNGGVGGERGVFLLKLCWDGGKDEMTACISKNVLEASTGICSMRFDGSEIFIEFVIGLKNNAFACSSLVPPTVSMAQ